MKETPLWGKLRPGLSRAGRFQKISDRFTPGIPDVLGMANGVGYAIELKELKGVKVLKAEFRKGQLDWLESWRDAGGVSLIVVTLPGSSTWAVFPPEFGSRLEFGLTPEELSPYRRSGWPALVDTILGTTT
jgi:hypothetical protein